MLLNHNTIKEIFMLYLVYGDIYASKIYRI